jgi:hypothetical protein
MPVSVGSPSRWQALVRDKTIAAAIIATALTVPLNLGVGHVPANRVLFLILASLGLTAFTSWARAAQRSRPSMLSLCTGAFLTAIAVSNVVNPYDRIVSVVINVSVVIVAAIAAKALIQHGNPLTALFALLAFLLVQGLVSLLQVQRNGAVGPWFFNESEAGFRRVDSILSPSGTVGHANQLGIFCVLAVSIALAIRARRGDTRVIRVVAHSVCVLGTALVALSTCRSALVALILLFLTGLISRQRKQLAVLLLVMAITVMGVAALRSDVWLKRTASSVGSVEQAGAGRMALNRQAVAVWRLAPVFGVGPGGYLDAIETNPNIKAMSKENLVVHNAWLYVLASLGLLGAGTFTAIGVAVFQRSVRRSPGRTWAVGLLLVLLPPLLLDVTLFAANGVLWLGTTLGLVLGLSSEVEPHK